MHKVPVVAKSLIFIVPLFLQQSSFGEEKAVKMDLSINESIELAIEHSQDIKIQQERAVRTKNTYRKVRAEALPQVDGDVAWDRHLKSPTLSVDLGDGSQKFPLKEDWELAASATLSQVLWAFGKVYTAINIAKKSINVENLNFQVARNELVFLVKQAYFTVLYGQRTVQIAQESYENALNNQKALQARFSGGRASRTEHIRMASDVENRIPPMLRAKYQLESFLIDFKDLIRVPRNTELNFTVSFKKDFDEYDDASLSIKMESREPTLLSLDEQVNLNSDVVRLRKTDYYPTLSAIANYTYAGDGEDTIPKDDMEPSALAGVRLTWELWDSGSRTGAVQEAQNDKNIAKLNYDKRLRDLRVELARTLAEYRSSKRVYEANLNALKIAEKSYRVTLSSYKAGSASQLQLNDSELQLTNAKLHANQTLFDIHLLMARVEKLIGQGRIE